MELSHSRKLCSYCMGRKTYWLVWWKLHWVRKLNHAWAKVGKYRVCANCMTPDMRKAIRELY